MFFLTNIYAMAFMMVATTFAPALVAPSKKTPSLNAKEMTIVAGKSFNFNINNKVKGSNYSWRVTNYCSISGQSHYNSDCSGR
jgi:hypothetical protein